MQRAESFTSEVDSVQSSPICRVTCHRKSTPVPSLLEYCLLVTLLIVRTTRFFFSGQLIFFEERWLRRSTNITKSKLSLFAAHTIDYYEDDKPVLMPADSDRILDLCAQLISIIYG